jgi:hypothetical protein
MNISNSDHIHNLLQLPPQLIKHIIRRLYERNNQHPVFPIDGIDWQTASAVLFSLGRYPQKGRFSGEPCLILNPAHYARYRLRFEAQSSAAQVSAFPCFRYEKENKAELLWGATYRITAVFLEYVFGFVPPDVNSLPEIHGRLSRAYLSPAQ